MQSCNGLNDNTIYLYHSDHHICNSVDNIELYIGDILKTWKSDVKMHFSSPKSLNKKEFRSHNDYIDVDEFILFDTYNIAPKNANINIEADTILSLNIDIHPGISMSSISLFSFLKGSREIS